MECPVCNGIGFYYVPLVPDDFTATSPCPSSEMEYVDIKKSKYLCPICAGQGWTPIRPNSFIQRIKQRYAPNFILRCRPIITKIPEIRIGPAGVRIFLGWRKIK